MVRLQFRDPLNPISGTLYFAICLAVVIRAVSHALAGSWFHTGWLSTICAKYNMLCPLGIRLDEMVMN